MKPRITLLRRTCREAAALIIAREDNALKLSDTVALKLHLLACKACPKFENQVLTMRAAMGQWRNYGEQNDPAKPQPQAHAGRKV
ncbi:MAG: zf-HC2 domain-containing protein [Pseudomonadota bacterium]